MDLNGGNTGNGDKIQIWDCNGKPNQQWQFTAPPAPPAPPPPPGGSITIVLTRHGEKCVKGCKGKQSGADLTADGRARADYLKKCFATGSSALPALPFTSSDSIAGFDGKNPFPCHREKELAMPLANAVGIDTKSSWNCDTYYDYGCAERHVKAAIKKGSQKIWLVWEHRT